MQSDNVEMNHGRKNMTAQVGMNGAGRRVVYQLRQIKT